MRPLRSVFAGVVVLVSMACGGSPGSSGASDTLTVSPKAGSYPYGLVVTITAPSADAVVYFTTDGSEPNNSAQILSPNFTGGSHTVTLLASTTVRAFSLTGGGRTPMVSVTYSITPAFNQPLTPEFAAGFAADSNLQLNGDAILSGTRLRLTSGLVWQAGSVFFVTPVNVQSFTTTFEFQLSPVGALRMADGITFTVQDAGPYALGSRGGGIGFGAEPIEGTYKSRIDRSVAVKFDTFDDVGEGDDSIGVFTDGSSPTVPADLLPVVDLHSGHVFAAQITYDGVNLSITITDRSVPAPSPTFTTSYRIDVPATIGSTTGYVGFTGATGGCTSVQEILTWTFSG
jgi:hypothetical protein